MRPAKWITFSITSTIIDKQCVRFPHSTLNDLEIISCYDLKWYIADPFLCPFLLARTLLSVSIMLDRQSTNWQNTYFSFFFNQGKSSFFCKIYQNVFLSINVLQKNKNKTSIFGRKISWDDTINNSFSKFINLFFSPEIPSILSPINWGFYRTVFNFLHD